MISHDFTVGAGEWGQQAKQISLADLARVKKTSHEKFEQETPIVIIVSILIESNTTILRYLATQNLHLINNDILITHLQNNFTMVILALSELESRLGLENPIILGLYCTVIRSISESKCALLTALTSYSIMAHCYGRVGAEYNNCLTVNNARRLGLCGFLTTRSPNLTITKV